MRSPILRTSLAAGLLGACCATLAPAADALELSRGSVVASGGARSLGGSFDLTGTVGQPVVGISFANGFLVCHGYWCTGQQSTVDVEPSPDGPPSVLEFGLPTPNPSPGAVSFRLALPVEKRVDLEIFDIRGRMVRRVAGGLFGAGVHSLRWDGAMAAGQPSAPGVYFARLRLGGTMVQERTVVITR